MMQGDIVLSDSKSGFISRAIKWFTGSEFSHSFVVAPPIYDIQMCLEASENGVDMCRFDTHYGNNQSEGYEVWTVNLPQDVKDAALKQVMNDLEILYGFFQYPWFVWRKINLLLGRDIKSQNNWCTDGMICSQLVVAFLTTCGLGHIFDGYGEGSIAPQDLKEIFMAHPDLFTCISVVRLP